MHCSENHKFHAQLFLAQNVFGVPETRHEVCVLLQEPSVPCLDVYVAKLLGLVVEVKVELFDDQVHAFDALAVA